MNRITLTTDFGDRDGFVGIMKGVIADICPEARVIDIAHGIPRGDLLHAAFILRNSYLYFPVGTVHVVVVDPGVGSERRAVVVRGLGQFFVAPDNGVLAWAVHEMREAGEELEAWALEDARFHLDPVSNTFHGRDIFAPVGAFLAKGVDPAELGPPIPVDSSAEGGLADSHVGEFLPGADGDVKIGRIVHIDSFGNCITSLGPPKKKKKGFAIEIETLEGWSSVGGLADSYAELQAGAPGIVLGSTGLLEIAIFGASAAEILGLTRGARVRLTK